MANILTAPIVNSQSGTLSFSPGQIAGYSIRETAGARAVLRFRNGPETDREQNILLTISLAAGESARDWFMPTGIPFDLGLYVEVVSGTIEGAAQIMSGNA